MASEFSDSADYSDDMLYRWWYERRWGPGGTLCWVGLNPGTGDTDSGPRPSLQKVVGWARRAGCEAVTVVNLFSYRATDPAELRTAAVDVVGHRTDEAIQAASAAARITLVAWGAHKMARVRADAVMNLLVQPVCVGVTKAGEPRHPLYVPAAASLTTYQRVQTGR